MNIDTDSRLSKVRALLAKAESTSHPEEAKAFAAKAQELMAKWAIDESMLQSSRHQDTYGDIGTTDLWIDANEYRSPKVDLLSRLSSVNDCRLVLFTQQYTTQPGDDKPKRRFRVSVIGHTSDREFLISLYTSLLLQSAIELTSPDILARKQVECTHGGHGIAWRNAFMFGYSREIHSRMHAAKERAKSQAATQYGTGMSLVLVGRTQLVERKMNELHPCLSKGKRSSASTHRGSAGQLGEKAGSRADLGNPQAGYSQRGQIGN